MSQCEYTNTVEHTAENFAQNKNRHRRVDCNSWFIFSLVYIFSNELEHEAALANKALAEQKAAALFQGLVHFNVQRPLYKSIFFKCFFSYQLHKHIHIHTSFADIFPFSFFKTTGEKIRAFQRC